MEILNYKNFASAELLASIDASQTSITLKPGQGANLPASPFYGVLEQRDVNDIVVKKEIIKVTAKTGDTLTTVIRAQDGSTADSFDGTSTISQYPIAQDFEELQLGITENGTVPVNAKTTPADADVFTIRDSVASFIKKKVTWSNIKATLKTYFDTLYHAKNALRTGLTATRLLLTDGSGNEGYLAGGSAGQFLNHAFVFATPTITPGIAILQGTRAINTATGTQVIAHGLGVVPKRVEAHAVCVDDATTNSSDVVAMSTGWSKLTTHGCTYKGFAGSNGTWDKYEVGNSANLIFIRNTNNASANHSQTQQCTVTADATNITLNWTYTLTGSSSLSNNISFTILCIG